MMMTGIGRRWARAAVLLGGLAALSGCAGAAVEVARGAASEATINKHMAAAQAGDAKAQYEVGSAYCCSVNAGSELFNTPKAVSWLCRSAAQGYAPAMLKIGRIYNGDTVEGVRLSRRLANAVVGQDVNLAVSYAWLTQAAQRGEADAAEDAKEVWNDMNATQRTEARRLVGMGTKATCRWEEAIRG